LRNRLESFRKKVSTGRLVRQWSEPAELPGLVAVNLLQTIKTYPSTGWSRNSSFASEELLAQINHLRIENEKLSAENNDLRSLIPKTNVNDLISGNEKIHVHFAVRALKGLEEKGSESIEVEFSCDTLFGMIAPLAFFLILLPHSKMNLIFLFQAEMSFMRRWSFLGKE
jgi:hypothetical protein